jgi:protein CpxP
MRKLVLIAMTLVAMQATAQEKNEELQKDDQKERAHKLQDFTPEEVAALHTKQMTLDLDLTKAQQDKIYKINLENAKGRKTKMEDRKTKKEKGSDEKPSKEERLQHMSDRLDNQIARKRKMKGILNADQYEKWSKKSARMKGKKRSSQKHKKRQ